MQYLLEDRKSKLHYVYDLVQDFYEPMRLTFSPDGAYALFCQENSIQRICFQTGKISNFTGIYDKINDYDFLEPHSSTFSPDGSFVLVCDSRKHCIRKIDIQTKKVTIFAGSLWKNGFNNGPRAQALFDLPLHLVFSIDGTCALICDNQNHCIRKICLKTGEVSTFVGIPGAKGCKNGSLENARLNKPVHLNFSPDGTYILVCDTDNFCIRKICLQTEIVSTFAGIPSQKGSRNGAKEHAIFNYPICLTFSPDGKYILVCDLQNIRKICLESGQVSTFAGHIHDSGHRHGPKEPALFDCPSSITFSKNGKFVIICDANNIKFIKIKI
jgi:WD40 repeat protein